MNIYMYLEKTKSSKYMYMPRKDIDKKNHNSKSNAKEPVVQFNINEPVMTMLIDGNNMTIDSMQFNNTVVQPFDKAKKIDQDLPVDFVKQQVKDIWDNIDNGKIKLSYAVVGVTFNGRQVYSYDALIDLLSSYGYQIQSIVQFLNSFQTAIDQEELEKSDKVQCPVIMYSVQHWNIFNEVKPFKHLSKKRSTKK